MECSPPTKLKYFPSRVSYVIIQVWRHHPAASHGRQKRGDGACPLAGAGWMAIRGIDQGPYRPRTDPWRSAGPWPDQVLGEPGPNIHNPPRPVPCATVPQDGSAGIAYTRHHNRRNRGAGQRIHGQDGHGQGTRYRGECATTQLTLP